MTGELEVGRHSLLLGTVWRTRTTVLVTIIISFLVLFLRPLASDRLGITTSGVGLFSLYTETLQEVFGVIINLLRLDTSFLQVLL